MVVLSAQVDGECDANSGDETCAAPADQEEGAKDDRECVDTNPSCRAWASVGECDNNPNYMLSELSLILQFFFWFDIEALRRDLYFNRLFFLTINFLHSPQFIVPYPATVARRNTNAHWKKRNF